MHFKRIQIDVDRFKVKDPDTSRFIILSCVAVIVFMGLSAAVAFFLALRGTEQTMVPDMRGMELTNALIEMQDKQLYPRVQLRYSNSVGDSGTILEQDPRPGSIVKAGRRVKITVSKGSVVDKVENFVGQQLDEVKIHLQTLFTNTDSPLVSIQDPPTYVFDAKEPGTILDQKPISGTPIAKPVKLVLVVSRGPEKAKQSVPALMGLGLKPALRAIEGSGVAATFTSRKREGSEAPLSICSQLPAAGASIPATTKVALVISEPEKKDGWVFGILKQRLPEYPYALKLKVESVSKDGERETLLEQNNPGGDFSLPYYLPSGSSLELSILGQVKYRLNVDE
jgi:eukaryotic-like serine/threonine-protein kinase